MMFKPFLGVNQIAIILKHLIEDRNAFLTLELQKGQFEGHSHEIQRLNSTCDMISSCFLKLQSRWWFQICFIFTPTCGRFPF